MTARERKVVAGGVVALLIILAGAMIPRLLGGAAGDDTAALQAERVARLRGLAASVDTLAQLARASARAERAGASRYLGGGTPQVAAAELSAVVQGIAEVSRVEVLREGVLPAREVGRATAVPLQVTARGDMPGLLELLRGLERNPLLLTVEDITVGADPRERPGVPTLTVSLRVSGYLMRTPTTEEAS